MTLLVTWVSEGEIFGDILIKDANYHWRKHGEEDIVQRHVKVCKVHRACHQSFHADNG